MFHSETLSTCLTYSTWNYLTNFHATNFLKVQSCKLYNNKYMIPSTQIKNTKIFTFIEP